MKRIAFTALAMALVAVALPAAAQQKYPNKPVRMIVPFSPGSQTDITARLVGQKLGEKWGEQIVVDNRPSGGGTVAFQMVSTSTPDGHTLMAHSSGYAISPWLYPKLKIDILRDFQAVSLMASTPQVIVVGKDLGVKSVKDLVALMKSKGAQFPVAVPGIGSSSHLVTEKFYLAIGGKANNIWYKGTPECMTDTMAGRTSMSFLPLAPTVPFLRDGRLIGLAVSGKDRSPVVPDIPTVAESGFPGFDYTSWFLLAAPAKTPKAIVEQASAEVRRVLALPDVKERLATLGATPVPMTPAEAQAFVKAEYESLGKLIKAAGVTVD